MENTLQPKHFQPGEGESYKVGRMTMTFKTSAAPGLECVYGLRSH